MVSLLYTYYSLATVAMAALDPKQLPVERKALFTPTLQDLADVLNKGLKVHFSEVQVDVVDCPDLTQPPFTLANVGLNGSPRLVEVGGPPYLVPLVNRTKVYDLRDIPKLADLNSGFLIGAGAGPYPFPEVNCEGIININIDGATVDQHTRIAKINVTDGSYIQERLPNSETRFALLGNYLISEGKPGPVLKVFVRRRIGTDDFIASIRKTLADHYGSKIVGLGGTFILKEGKAKQHVMPDFSKTPLNSDEDVNKWLKFFNMSAPLIALGTLVTGEYDLDLRVQHFHSFSHHGDAGHYHIDTTPDSAEYLGYFNVAEFVYRIDKPVSTHKVGRD